MAIKISGSTIIDDSRGIVNAGISTFVDKVHLLDNDRLHFVDSDDGDYRFTIVVVLHTLPILELVIY